jgi:hypothetical protein
MTPKELAVDEGKPIALSWIDSALTLLAAATAEAEARAEEEARLRAALVVNFSVPAADVEPADVVRVIRLVAETYARAREILVRSDRWFVGVSEEAARRFFPPAEHADIPPAYAIFGEAVYFTPRFAPWDPSTKQGFGPFCRAAMVLHETIHVIDAESGTPEVHISEWDEPGFSAQTVEESLHNPSAYASFAAQAHVRAIAWPREARYGAGRPAD